MDKRPKGMSNVTATPSEVAQRKRRSLLADYFIRLVREKPLGTAGAIIVVALLFAGIFADFVATHDPNELIYRERNAPPSAAHLLGTDHMGRDLYSRIIFGARLSVIVGLSAAAISAGLATILGVLSGFLGGKVDMVVQRFVDAFMSFPGLLILLTIMSLVGRGVLQMVLILGIFGSIGSSRIVRSAVIGIKQNDYFQAAEAIGSPTLRTLARHVLPNIMAPIIIIFSGSIGGVILAEASLSFLGFGLPLETPSWGGMLAWEGSRYMEQSPALALWPGLCLTLVVFGTNLFGDAVRDLLDPRLRGG